MLSGDIDVRRAGTHLSAVVTRQCVSALVATGDGVEVLQHRLVAGGRFGLVPQKGWLAFESITVISGVLECISGPMPLLGPGDTVSAWPVREPYVFEARDEAVVMHVSSQPMFESGAEDVRALKEMARKVAETDGYTHEHCLRVQTLAAALGRAAQLPPERLHWLLYGAFLHDVGKSRVPTEIVQKHGPLTLGEWVIMRQHPTWGREIVDGTHIAKAGPIIEQHHERLDGTGYPNGLKGDEICIEAQIVSIVDLYEALTSERPYRKALSPADAIVELRRYAGRFFNSDLVEMFAQARGE
jgi:putative nucleotidyltransferase with HDIG domain